MRANVCALLLALLSSASQGAAPGDLCAQLRTFEAAQLEKGQRRWIEFHWYFDPTAIWSWGCRHSKDEVATTTCGWLMHNANQEFPMVLPHGIMRCHGYTFPKYAADDWRKIAGTITLRGPADRRVLMDIDYRNLPGGEQAMRVSVEDPEARYEPNELPPIKPMPKVRPKQPST